MEIDKTTELRASVKLVNDRLKFSGEVLNNNPVEIDYISPLGDNDGYTSLELLLLSLSSCVGSAVLTFLRRMQKEISGCEVNARGIRNTSHPTGFKTIYIDFVINSSDVTMDDFDKVLKLAEDSYCPVWAMLKGNVEIITGCNIVKHK